MCNEGCNPKVNAEIYGSSPNHPLKTDENGVLNVDASVNINTSESPCEVTGEIEIGESIDVQINEKNLVEEGQVYAFSYSSELGTGSMVVISNPKNSGKTIRIKELLVYSDIKYSGLYCSVVELFWIDDFQGGYEEIQGGCNLNFGFADVHIAKLYVGMNGWIVDKNAIMREGISLGEKKFIFKNELIMPPSEDEDRALIINLLGGTVSNVNFTVIWSEE